jgi:hypothetical protein
MNRFNVTEASGVIAVGILFVAAAAGMLYYRSQVQSVQFLAEMQVDPALHAGNLRVDMRKSVKNEDVLILVKAGASRDVIYRLIRRAPAQFKVDSTDVVELRKAGVPNDIIGQMIEAMNDGDAMPVTPMQKVAVPVKMQVNEFATTAQ